MRPNLFANTPDILHEYLQTGGRPAFQIRLVLAATLGANYGIYGPAFELVRAAARVPGSRGVPRLGEVPAAPLGPRRPGQPARADRAGQRDPPREPGAAEHDAGLRFHPDRQRRSCSCYAKTHRRPVERRPRRRQPRPAPRAGAAGSTCRSRELGLDAGRAVPGRTTCSATRATSGTAPRNYVALDPHAPAGAHLPRPAAQSRTEQRLRVLP